MNSEENPAPLGHATAMRQEKPFENSFEIVGVLPAAGHARRLGTTVQSSKELLPIVDSQGETRPVSHFLLQQMVHAGCDRAIIVLRPGKWDIPATLGPLYQAQLPLAYCTIEDSWGPPFTVAEALPFARGAAVATGFPDILIDPPDAMTQVIHKLRTSQADVVVATFDASKKDGCDLCVADADNRVRQIAPKEQNPPWQENSQTWLLAAWRPSFTEFFTTTLTTFAAEMSSAPPESKRDLPLGAIMSKALSAGYQIQRVHFPAGRFLDIGSPERLTQANHFFAQSNE